MQKQKIAILGGGTAAISAAFELTDPALNGQYDVTVYQLGWRLGGKAASGRNLDPDYAYRIEEHGVHVWAGLYDNAFRIMRACYAELGRPPDAPLATWKDAFKPAELLVVEEKYKEKYFHWPFPPPTNDQLPGDPDARLFLPFRSYLGEALRLLRQHHKGRPPSLLNRLEAALVSVLLILGFVLAKGFELVLRLLDAISKTLGNILSRLIQRLILGLLTLFIARLWRSVKDKLDDAATRQHWIFANFAYGTIRGMIKDDIFQQGFDVLDDQDYRQWLGQYLCDDDDLTVNSPLALFLYDAGFAYLGGDLQKPNFSASVALYILFRLAFTWKGALFWKMQAGTGDTVFAPLYQVLKRRGVTFKFFHRVKNLHLSDDGTAVTAITIGRQVQLKKEAYDPLVTINGLDCWPSTPLWDQIVDGETYKGQRVNFEAWCTEDYDGEITLTVGEGADKDFNQVVLGISLATLPHICCELIKANADWKKMVDNVLTVRTQAFQLWLKPTAFELGWTLMRRPVLGTYDVSPLDTWADMSQLLCREGWPARADQYPLNIAYFCGPMKDGPFLSNGCGPLQDCETLSQEAGNEHTKALTLALLNNDIAHLWPRAVTNNGFNWDLLVDNRAGVHRGEDRLDAQYIRANVQPSERYVMSVAGSTRYRLAPGDSRFKHLVLAGDWTNNGFNAGGIEAAVMSGMLASNAISGFPKRDKIVGLTFGHHSLKL